MRHNIKHNLKNLFGFNSLTMLKHKIVLSSIPFILTIMIISIFSINTVITISEQLMEDKLSTNMTSIQALSNKIITGKYNVRDGILYKGDVRIDGNFIITDQIEDLTGNYITIYLNDESVTSSMRIGSSRAIGIKAQSEVKTSVLEEGSSYTEKISIDKNKYIINYIPLYNDSEKIIGMFSMAMKSDFIDKAIRGIITKIILISIFALGISIAIIIRITDKIVYPIKKIKDDLNCLEQGDADLTVKIQSSTKDETNQLVYGFNRFIDKLREMIILIKNSSFHLKQACSLINSSLEALTEKYKNISEILSDLREKSRINIDRAKDINKILSDAKESEAKTVNSIEQVYKAGENFEEKSNEATLSIRIMMEKIFCIEKLFLSFNKSTLKLEESFSSIEHVADILDQISERTNLLAINASIEAAHAGEYGKGFSVVAQEVRNLSTESSSSLASIKKIVKSLSHDANTIIQESSQINVIVKESFELGDKAQDNIASMNKFSSYFLKDIQYLLTDSMEQIQRTSVMQSSIKEIIEGIEITGKDTLMISDEVSSQSENFSNMLLSSAELLEISEELLSLTTRFKTEENFEKDIEEDIKEDIQKNVEADIQMDIEENTERFIDHGTRDQDSMDEMSCSMKH